MNKEYKHVIFDLDHTLWDFTANSNATLTDLYSKYNLGERGIKLEPFLLKYQLINEQMWYDYHRGKISKEDIRLKRFRITFENLGIISDSLADAINEDYLQLCPAKGHLIPYALEVLEYLKGKYRLHILTNGFSETQHIKITTSGLTDYFVEVVNSESCGFLKPHKEIFDYTLSRIAASCADCIMIGDDLYADVLGAKNAGIDQVYFNRNQIAHDLDLDYEISCLSELRNIL